MEAVKNFEDKWLENTGYARPTPEEIDQIINESVVEQKQRGLFTTTGRPYRAVAPYEHTERDVVFKVGHKKRKVVTLTTGGKVKKGG